MRVPAFGSMLIPLAALHDYRKTRVLSWILPAMILFRSLGVGFFPTLNHTIVEDLQAPTLTVGFFFRCFESLFTPNLPWNGVAAAFFWVLLGGVLEDRIGRVRLVCYYLLGAGLSFLAPLFPRITPLLPTYWLGLGATLFCIGVAYLELPLEDVKSILLFTTTEVPSATYIAFAHLLLAFGQVGAFYPRGFDAKTILVTPWVWVMLYPLSGVAVHLLQRAVGNVASALRRK